MPLSYDASSVFSLFSMKYMGSCPLNRKLFWVIFAFLDPDADPDSEYGPGAGSTIQLGTGSATLELSFMLYEIRICVATDPDPGSGVVLTPRSGMEKIRIRDPG